MLPVLASIVGCVLANAVYVMAAYDPAFKASPAKAYGLPILAAILSTAAWIWLIRTVDSDRQTFFINLTWDVGATLLVVSLPIFMYGFRVDARTVLGCLISIIGLVIAKTGKG